jgi:hypothetical protein
MSHGRRCWCRRCQQDRKLVDDLSRASLSAALRHAQNRYEYEDGYEDEFDAWEAGRRSKTSLPALDVAWSAPASMKDLSTKKPGAKDPAAKFYDRGKLRVYRIYKAGQSKPLYIGMVRGASKSVVDRLREHQSGKKVGRATSETKQLADALAAVTDPSQLLIRYGEIDAPKRFRNDAKFLHGVEMLLQAALKPQIYNPGSLSFEEVEEG